jgi:drug/metabolite transporter (DMT)-like permease
MQHRHTLAGIAFTTAAAACFSVLDTTVQYVSAFVPILMALWVRYAFQAVVTAAWLLPQRGIAMLHTQHLRLQMLRGALLIGSTGFAFASLKAIPVSEFTAVVMITPLVITLIAATALQHSVSTLRWLLVIVSFVGTMVIIRPFHQSFNNALLLPLGCVVCNVAFQLLTSKMARTEDPMTMHFYTGLVGMVIATLALPFVFVWLPSWHLWALLGLMGAASTTGHFLLIKAYQRTPPATLMPYQYTQIAFALLGGWLVFRYVPDQWSILGMAMIAASGAAGAWLTLREGRSTLPLAAVASAAAPL